MTSPAIAQSVALFLLAGLCEIGGGWLVWQWLAPLTFPQEPAATKGRSPERHWTY